MPKQELFNTIAAHLDHEIHSHYRLYPGNYVALDLLENTEAHASEYTPEDKARFEKYIAGQLAKIELPDKDEAFLKEKILAMLFQSCAQFPCDKVGEGRKIMILYCFVCKNVPLILLKC